MGTLLAVVFYHNYKNDLIHLDERLLSQMRICNFNLQCEALDIDFVPLDGHEVYRLYKDSKGVFAVFPIPGAKENALEIRLAQEDYRTLQETLFQERIPYILLVLLVISILSIVFSFYALYPLRNALILTEEFVKDILHDFNTPLASLRLNSAMLKQELGGNTKLERIETGVQSVLDLQENLKAYLLQHTLQEEEFFLDELVGKRLSILEKNYADLHFENRLSKFKVHTNLMAFERIIDNLLSNAAKYNLPGGRVEVLMNEGVLIIRDTGRGIKDTKRIFERFYKEHERGIGIGLHIVKKLSEALSIPIRVESKEKEGSSFYLDINKLLV